MSRGVQYLSYAVVFVALIGCVPAALAAPAAGGPAFQPFKLDQADLSVPESPAFTVLGVTPEEVVRPSNPRRLAASLLNGLDRYGNLQSGIALDFAPYLLTRAGRRLNLLRYREDAGARLGARTQMSIATTKGTGNDDKSIRLGLGLHLIPFDAGDPRLDNTLVRDLEDLGQFMLKDPLPTQEEINKRYRAILKAYRERAWNKPQWLIGYAPSWISPSGNSDDLRSNGYGVWTSFGYGFSATKQLIAHVRYRDRELAPNPDDPTSLILQNSTVAGARFRTGSPDHAISLEAVYTWQDPVRRKNDEFVTINLALEQKLSEGLWLGLALGGETGRRNGNRINFGATFKWGWTDKPQLVQE